MIAYCQKCLLVTVVYPYSGGKKLQLLCEKCKKEEEERNNG